MFVTDPLLRGSNPNSPQRACGRSSKRKINRRDPSYVMATPHRAGSAMPILDWSRHRLANADIAEGSTFAQEFATIMPRTVWLHANSLTAAAGARIGELLSGAPEGAQVTRLSLTDNQLGDAGVESLLSALSPRAAESLVSLNLGVNGVGPAAVTALAQAAGQGGSLGTLRELRLGGNDLSDDDLAALVEVASARAAGDGCSLRLLSDSNSTAARVGAPSVASAPGLRPVGMTVMVRPSAAAADAEAAAEAGIDASHPGLRPVGMTAMVRAGGADAGEPADWVAATDEAAWIEPRPRG